MNWYELKSSPKRSCAVAFEYKMFYTVNHFAIPEFFMLDFSFNADIFS